jgi:hypothetical protein
VSQKRIADYGSPAPASSLKALTSSFVVSARLSGMEFVVDGPNRVRVNPGKAVTHQGVIIEEDEAKTLTITNSSSPADYTILYVHEDADISGGVSAILTIESGLLTSSVVKGVILGYIRYPGGAVPLSTAHFIQPPALRIGDIKPSRENADWVLPLKGVGYLVTSSSGGALNLTDTYDTSPKPTTYLKVRNNGTVTGSTTLTFPFKVGDRPFALLQMRVGTDINATLTALFIDSAGTITTLGTLSGQPSIALQQLSIPLSAVQTPNDLVYVQFQMQLAINREIKIQALGLNTFNLPV